MISQCKICQLFFEHKASKHRKYCSKNCQSKHQENTKEKICCAHCSEEFTWYKKQKGKYCSVLCSQKGQVTKKVHNCLLCNETFIAHLSSNRKYCSIKCGAKSKEKPKNIRIKPKIIISKIQKYLECAQCKAQYKQKNNKKQIYCSVYCMSEAYKTRLIGGNNPNFGNRGKITAAHKRGCYKNRDLTGSKNPNFGNGHKIKAAYARGCYDNVPLPKHSMGKLTEYKGIVFRSTWEAEYAKYLDRNKIKWEYEKKKFMLSGGKKYFPDFYLCEHDKYIEIKGWWTTKARAKFALFKAEYPNVNIEVIDKEIWKI